ncbi:hypothetical protein MMC29_000150 [Sticta canariensis]|nr:hypothetical protein [Sticta canariensis]
MASETRDSPEKYTHSEIISRALKTWEGCDFTDLGLWETFKNDFEAKSLFHTLQEKERTPWTEEELIRCESEDFISSHIKNLLKYDFGRNPRIHSTYASISSPPRPATKFAPPPAARFAPPLATRFAPPPATRLAPSPTVRSTIAYPRLSRSLPKVRLPLASNQAVPEAYPLAHTSTTVDSRQPDVQPDMQPDVQRQQLRKPEMQQIRQYLVQYLQNPVQQPASEQPDHPISQRPPHVPAYEPLQPLPQLSLQSLFPPPPQLSFRPPSQLSFRPPPQSPYQLLPQPPLRTLFSQSKQASVSLGSGRKTSNLVKMYTDEAKYSGEDDSFTFKLSIFHDICARADASQPPLWPPFQSPFQRPPQRPFYPPLLQFKLTNVSSGHRRRLSNLAKVYTRDVRSWKSNGLGWVEQSNAAMPWQARRRIREKGMKKGEGKD